MPFDLTSEFRSGNSVFSFLETCLITSPHSPLYKDDSFTSLLFFLLENISIKTRKDYFSLIRQTFKIILKSSTSFFFLLLHCIVPSALPPANMSRNIGLEDQSQPPIVPLIPDSAQERSYGATSPQEIPDIPSLQRLKKIVVSGVGFLSDAYDLVRQSDFARVFFVKRKISNDDSTYFTTVHH